MDKCLSGTEGAALGCEGAGTQVSLEESYNPQIGLDVFKEDPNFQETEKKYEVGPPHFHRDCSVLLRRLFGERSGSMSLIADHERLRDRRCPPLADCLPAACSEMKCFLVALESCAENTCTFAGYQEGDLGRRR